MLLKPWKLKVNAGQDICAILLEQTMSFRTKFGRPGGIRTPNTRIWSPTLYRWSYWPASLLVRTIQYQAITTILGCLLCFLVDSMSLTETTVFFKFQFIRGCPLVLRRRVVFSFTLGTRKGNDDSHDQTPLRPIQ